MFAAENTEDEIVQYGEARMIAREESNFSSKDDSISNQFASKGLYSGILANPKTPMGLTEIPRDSLKEKISTGALYTQETSI